jgi:Ulp1 family protease
MTNLLDKGYEGIKRWSKRAKIDGKKLYDVQDVFIPINRNAHWTVLVISPKNRTIRYYDSLGGNGRAYVAAATQWLRGELGTAFIEGDWMIDNTAASPMQNNGSDCGVFAITTAKQLMLGRSPMTYGAGEIPVQRRRIVAELVAGKLL